MVNAIVCLYSKIHVNPINVLCRQTVEILIVKADFLIGLKEHCLALVMCFGLDRRLRVLSV